MKEFEYVIKEPIGLHARPASVLAKKAMSYKSSVTIFREGNFADAKRLLKLMALGVKCSESVRFEIEGEDEDTAAEDLKAFCTENL
jgi:Phosphotransferase System HPr (HPr) Family